MHLKIYFQDKPLYLTDKIDEEIEPFIHQDDAIYMDEFSTPGINSMIHEMRLKKVQAGVYFHKDLEKLHKAFRKKFVVIQAAGGLIRNEKQEILVMKRRNKWDLPKGKLDPGETLETCAVREVREETGLKDVSIDSFLLPTYHTYEEEGKPFLKETHWYKMIARGNETLHPETGEQITEVIWVHPDKISEVLLETYSSIVDVFLAAGLK